MNNIWFVIIIVILVIGAGFILVKSGEDVRPGMTNEATKSASPKGKYSESPGVFSEKEITGKHIRIKTKKGDIEFELFGKEAPKAVSNFIFLTNEGFYNGLTFHRRDEGFV